MNKQKFFGILCFLISILCSVMLTLSFSKAGSTSSYTQVMITSAGATVLAFILLIMVEGKKGFKMNSAVKWYVVRSFLTGCGMATLAYAAKNLGPNETTLVQYTTPLWTMLIAAILRIERMRIEAVVAVIVCIGAIFVSFSGDTHSTNNIATLCIALFSSMCFGCYDVVCRKQSDKKEKVLTQAFYAFLITTVILMPAGLYGLKTSESRDIVNSWLLSPVRLGIVLSVFAAYKFTPINILVPTGYFRLPIMMLMAYIITGTIPSYSVTICGIIIIATNIVTIMYSSYLEKKIKTNDAEPIATA